MDEKCEKSKDEIFYNKTFNVNYDECFCLNSKNVSLNTPKANFDSGTFIVRIKAKNNDIVDNTRTNAGLHLHSFNIKLIKLIKF